MFPRGTTIHRHLAESVNWSFTRPRSRLPARNEFRVARDLGVVERMLPSQVRAAIFTVGFTTT